MKRCTMCGKFHWGNPDVCKSCGAAFNEQQIKQQPTYLADDSSISQENLTFAILFEDSFVISGKGTVVTGFSQTDIKIGDILVNELGTKQYKVIGIQTLKARVDAVPPRTNCGLILSNFTKENFVKNEPFFIKK